MTLATVLRASIVTLLLAWLPAAPALADERIGVIAAALEPALIP